MPKSNPGTILVCSDFMLQPWLDIVSSRLEKDGFCVVQGPASIPPEKVDFSSESLRKLLSQADVILATNRNLFGKDALTAAVRAKGVVYPAIGTDSIDLAAATGLGIPVAHGPTPENYRSMAESTVLLILALSYELREKEQFMRDNLPRPTSFSAGMLFGKTIGLIGYGRIAKAVAERLETWGVNILAYSPRATAGERVGSTLFVGLDTLLSQSDFVSVHTTLTPETRHLVNAERLGRMKKSAFLVNTARGEIVDENALIEALSQERIAGAALDTFELEPLQLDSPLRGMKNVILTPHLIGHTREIYDVIPKTAYQNIRSLLEHRTPLYIRNPEVYLAWAARFAQLAPYSSHVGQLFPRSIFIGKT